MTAADVYELTTQGGSTDFALVVAACEASGNWCLIGDLAVNVYVEPVYTLDADLVVITSGFTSVENRLRDRVEEHVHSVNAQGPGSDLRIQFTTDSRYQTLPERAMTAEVLGVPARVACLEDTTQGKLWAYGDPQRRFSKRKKDELDLIRLLEAYPRLRAMYPVELLELIDQG